MKKLFIAALVFALGGTNILHAQNLPDQKETLNTLIKVNKHYMKNNPDCTLPSFVKGKMRASNIWTRTVYYEGLLALYSIYPDTEYYKYAYQWGDFHKWGMWRGTTTRHADNYACGQVYIDMYNLCPKPEILLNVKSNLNMLVNTPQINEWWWIDAIQMGMPGFAKMGKLTGE